MLDELTYEEFCRAHEVRPLNDIKEACRIANVGSTRLYELVNEGVFELISNGSRRNVTGPNLYRRYLDLVAQARSNRLV